MYLLLYLSRRIPIFLSQLDFWLVNVLCYRSSPSTRILTDCNSYYKQGDPLLRTLETTVVSATIFQAPASTINGGAKKSKKAVLAPDIPNEPLLQVILQDTIIFPEGGGQPTDTGLITTTSDASVWQVVQAKRHGGHAVHYVKIQNGHDVESALPTFYPGAKVTVSLGQEGYDRRYDHVSAFSY